jgi:hypothetical protein
MGERPGDFSKPILFGSYKYNNQGVVVYVLYSITHTPSLPTVLVMFARSPVVIKRERDSEFVNKASLELYHGQSSHLLLLLLPQPVDHTKRDPPTLHTVSQRPHPIFPTTTT